MALAISQAGVKVGIYTLLEAPLTLASSGAPVWIHHPGLVGSDKHRELFSRYRDEVDEVAAVALDWWTETLEAHLGPGEHTKEQKLKVWRNRPAGTRTPSRRVCKSNRGLSSDQEAEVPWNC